MGLGDFLDALVESNPVTSAAKGLVVAGAEKFIEHESQNARRAPGLPDPGPGHAQNLPGQPGAAIANIGENAIHDVGAKYGENIQAKGEAIMGFANLAKYAVTHDPRTTASKIKTVGQTMWDNPDLVWEGVKQGAIEGGIATAMDPTTYLGGGIALGAATGERILTRTAERTAARAAEEIAGRTAVRTADEIAGRTAAHTATEVAENMARRAAPAGLDKALTATARRGLASSTALGRGIESIDTSSVNLRESLTGNPTGRLGQARINLGEKILPGPQTSVIKAMGKDIIQANPTMPTVGAALPYRQSVFRATQIGRRLSAPARLRTTEQVGRFLYDPKRALTGQQGQDWARSAAEWAITEHPEAVAAVGGAVAATQAYGAYNTIKGIQSTLGIGGGGEEEAAAEPQRPAFEQPTPSTTQGIGLMQFRADQTHATRTSRRGPGRTRLGMVTKDSTMPSAIGPSNWYGPQGGYDAGRGFQQRPTTPSGALAPLEQPTTRPRETAGI